jgi:acetyltransferase
MSTLDSLFSPASIAVVGASNDTGRIRGRLLKLLIGAGFDGPVYPVNPGHGEIQGLAAYPSVLALPQAVDLALIAVAADQVMDVLAQCEQRQVKAAAIYTAGATGLPAGQRLEDQVAAFARRTGMRILGPNAEGFFDAERGMVATFSPTLERIPPHARGELPNRARVSIVSQSGAMAFALYGRARAQHIPVRHLVSTGNEADVELLEVVDHLIAEGGSRAILLFIEGLHRPERLKAAAERAADAGIVLIVAKIGRSQAGQRAAISHTAHLTGSDAAYDAVLRRHGAIRVDTPEEMLAIAAAVSAGMHPAGRRVAIVTTSGGAGGWAADICEQAGLEVPPFQDGFKQELAAIVPAYGSTENPVDVTAQVVEDGGATLLKILRLLERAPGIDIGLIVISLVAPERLTRIEAELAEIHATSKRPLVFHSAGVADPAALAALARAGGVHLDVDSFARAMLALDEHRRFLEQRRQDAPATRLALPAPTLALPQGKAGILDARALRELFSAWDIPVPRDALAATAPEAARAAADLGWPVALKIATPDIAHKTEAGGVELNLNSPAEVQAAGVRILASARRHDPNARIDGLQVQKMMPPGRELVVGVVRDPDFGPMVMLGLGGIYIEVLRDVVLAPAPLTDGLARGMIHRLKAREILLGARGEPAADIDALARLLVNLSELAVAHAASIREIDLNPVLVYPAGHGVVAVDALVVVEENNG